jgi:hypothetical protein
MKKFSAIVESTTHGENLVKLIGELDNFRFVTYTLGMKDVIDTYLNPHEEIINFNSDKKYQEPLSWLHSTGKYPEILEYKSSSGTSTFWSKKLITRSVLSKGKWHPINKLNTNSFDQAELLLDLIKAEGHLESIITASRNISFLKSLLIEFVSNNDILGLIKKHGFRLSNYLNHIKKLSKLGEISEATISKLLEDKNYQIHKGGDGDPIDMTFGIDIIAKKGDDIFTIQVKRTLSQAMIASKQSRYRRIDYFYYANKGNVGFISKLPALF